MEPGSKYFFIKSQLHGLVLDVHGAGNSVGTKVVMWNQKSAGYDNQLFLQHPMTGTIRPKHAPHLVLDVPDDGTNTLILNAYSPSSAQQQWVCNADGRVRCRNDQGRVLDIAGAKCEAGARVCAWKDIAKPHQRWTFVYQNRDYFFLSSIMHGMVLDICGEDPSPGASVITWDKKAGAPGNQLWYEDCHGFLRSKFNDLVLDTSGGTLTTAYYDPCNVNQQWCVDRAFIRNQALQGKVLDIRGANRSGGANVIPYGEHGGDNQRWTTVCA